MNTDERLRTGVAGTVLAIALVAATGARAQDATATADADTPEDIVVTGFRSINKPLAAIKRDADQMVDTLTQAQIERLPGVSADRGFSSSNARTVTVRGFDDTPRVTLSPASLAAASNPANWVQRTGRPVFDLQLPHRDDVYHASADLNWNSQSSARYRPDRGRRVAAARSRSTRRS